MFRPAGSYFFLACLTSLGNFASSPAKLPPPPCGIEALYVLCRLENFPADLATVQKLFESPHPAGHSIPGIAAAARCLGLNVHGMRLKTGPRKLDRPALVFIERGTHGHFVVVRPVGHTGTLVQVIDAHNSVEVLDYTTLTRQPGWTGYGLVPSRNNTFMRLTLSGALLIIILVSLFWFLSRILNRSSRKLIQPT